jgi:hypothetical protein
VALGKHPYSVELTITSETSYEELSKKSRKSSMSGVLHRGGRSRQSNGNRLANARTLPCNQGDFTDQSFAMHAE